MATSNLLFQALTETRHVAAINELLQMANVSAVWGGVAFAREDGVKAVRTALTRIGKRAKLFVGVRNEITSSQALEALFATGAEIYAVDTAKRSVLFHPKAYLATTPNSARLLIGSANLTHSGLHNNVEFGAQIDYDLNLAGDAGEVNKFTTLLDSLPCRFPKHVAKVTPALIKKLFDEGRIEDESVQIIVPPRAKVRTGARDTLGPIDTPFLPPPTRVRKRIRVSPVTASPTSAAVPVPTMAHEFELVWKSKGLKERDLNIPTGSNTNATGSMLWKQGLLDDVDQRHFFRDEVFPEVGWARDISQSKSHLERATARFRIVVKGIDLGVFLLKMTHNTDTKSRSYEQNNAMTQVHWGAAKPHIAKPDLLGRTMSLYRKSGAPPEYLMEID